MHLNPKSHYLRQTLFMLWLLALGLVSAACTPVGHVPVSTPMDASVSPLTPVNHISLFDHRWLVAAVVEQGEALAFDTLGTVHIHFDARGALNFYSVACAGGAYRMNFKGGQTYELTQGEIGLVDCGELKMKQYDALVTALGTTTAYKLVNNQVYLAGDNVQFVLEIDDPH